MPRLFDSEVPRAKHSVAERGEADAYGQWLLRCGRSYSNSWEALADMRHFGIPTRLLDWTEVLLIAVFFALNQSPTTSDLVDPTRPFEPGREERGATFLPPKDFWHTCLWLWRDPYVPPDGCELADGEPLNGRRYLRFPRENLLANLKQPCVWVLNPYRLAERTIGDRTIFDYSTRPDLEYHRAFLSENNSRAWPYSQPVPMIAPWFEERRRAQQSSFTVFGDLREPLDRSVPGVAKKVLLGPSAAVFAVHHLLHVAHIDRYSMNRDLDALGDKVRNSFFRPS